MSKSDTTPGTTREASSDARTDTGISITASDESKSGPSSGAVAERVIDKLFRDHCVCNWCFDRRRIPYPEYDEARANEVDMGENRSAVNSISSTYRRRDDGTLQVISATSGPDPRAYRDVVDGRPRDGFFVPDGYLSNPSPSLPPRPKTICGDCAQIDIDPTADRSDREMITAIRNLLDRVEELDADLSVHERAAVGLVKELRGYPEMQGKDRYVLARALAYGIRKEQSSNSNPEDNS